MRLICSGLTYTLASIGRAPRSVTRSGSLLPPGRAHHLCGQTRSGTTSTHNSDGALHVGVDEHVCNMVPWYAQVDGKLQLESLLHNFLKLSK